MEFLHSMIRVLDLEKNLTFFTEGLGLKLLRRNDYENWKCTLVYLATEEGAPEIELTYNWGEETPYGVGNSFGHLAFAVENIYEACTRLQEMNIPINRPPRDGHMAFVKSPDGISIELLQKGEPLEPCLPWTKLENIGTW